MDAALRDLTPDDAFGPIGAPRPARSAPLRFAAALPGAAFADILGERPLGGRLRAVRRLALVVLWTLLAIPVQAVLLGISALPSPALARPKVAFARFYWQALRRLFGLRVKVIGAPAAGPGTLFVVNHSSWLDILVLGGALEACFVSKAEVGCWPLVGTVARLGRTVFVSRARGRTGAEAGEMQQRLAAGDSLILFPEGTSSDGTRVLPFRSSLLAAAGAAAAVQPVSVGYDRLGGLPACRRDRPHFAWYGDMDIGRHAWRLARRPGGRATVLLHRPCDPAGFPDRKGLALAAQAAVAEGAAALRQNRAAVALSLRRASPVAG